MPSKVGIADYFATSYCDYSSYDNIRKVASAIDGNKISMRKCLHVVLKDNIKSPVKVQNFCADAAKKTNYVHGAASLYGVVVGMAQEFAGANNIPLLKRKGAFGTRTIPEAAADRYIFTCMEDIIPKIFMAADNPVLPGQVFEGDPVEPRHFAPIIPMLLANGSIGLTTGFLQRILPRNPKELVKWVKAKLAGKKPRAKLDPWFAGFNGTVAENSERPGAYNIWGACEAKPGAKVEITDVPIGYDLQAYLKVLDKLVDSKQIKDYDDMSEANTFRIVVQLYRNQGIKPDSPTLKADLKLCKPVVESYTSLDEDNKIAEYKSVEEILEAFYAVRYKYYEKRLAHNIEKITADLLLDISRYAFVKGILNGEIDIKNKPAAQVESQLSAVKGVVKKDGSYNYLLDLPCSQLTKEKYQKLREQVKAGRDKLAEAKKATVEAAWLADLAELEKAL